MSRYFYLKYFCKNFFALARYVSVSSSSHADNDSGNTEREKFPSKPISLSLMRRLSRGMFPSQRNIPSFSSVLSERYTRFIVFPRRTRVFMRSTPLDGSTLLIERAVCSVIFLIVSGLASPYSEIRNSHVFGGAFTILMIMFGYFAWSVLRESPNQPFSLSSLCGGWMFTIQTPSSLASSRMISSCFFVRRLSGAVIDFTGIPVMPTSK